MDILIVYPTVELVAFMKEVAAAAPNTPFYLYDINFMTGVYCKYRRLGMGTYKNETVQYGIRSNEIVQYFNSTVNGTLFH